MFRDLACRSWSEFPSRLRTCAHRRALSRRGVPLLQEDAEQQSRLSWRSASSRPRISIAASSTMMPAGRMSARCGLIRQRACARRASSPATTRDALQIGARSKRMTLSAFGARARSPRSSSPFRRQRPAVRRRIFGQRLERFARDLARSLDAPLARPPHPAPRARAPLRSNAPRRSRTRSRCSGVDRIADGKLGASAA